ncbi:hypothetical protein T439DRAFT_330178 [Meredithblackwellia eburnea MCA 4105]
MGKRLTKKQKKTNDIRSFFTNNTTPAPARTSSDKKTGKQVSLAATPKQSSKGKGKQREILVIDSDTEDDEDDDIQIVERLIPTNGNGARKRKLHDEGVGNESPSTDGEKGRRKFEPIKQEDESEFTDTQPSRPNSMKDASISSSGPSTIDGQLHPSPNQASSSMSGKISEPELGDDEPVFEEESGGQPFAGDGDFEDGMVEEEGEGSYWGEEGECEAEEHYSGAEMDWTGEGGGDGEDWGTPEDGFGDASTGGEDDSQAARPDDYDEEEEDEEDMHIVQGCSKDLEDQPPMPKSKSSSKTPLRCPVCDADLVALGSSLKRELHVNRCLDGAMGGRTGEGSVEGLNAVDDESRTSENKSVWSSIFRFGSTANTSTSTSSTSSSKSKPKPTVVPTKSSLTPLSRLPNAFTTLMTSSTTSKQWAHAQESDNLKGRLPKGVKREVPFYKWVEGMRVTVDAFRYGRIEGCRGYFLSHAHSDHYQNMNSSWNAGPIYCSQTTANLIKLKLKVKDEFLKPLPLNETVTIPGTDGKLQVTLIDANHCPGSVLFFFEGPHTDPKSPWTKTPSKIFRYLHCGDFRASPLHVLHPSLLLGPPGSPNYPTSKRIDACYLDTTYLDPKYCFPAQKLVVQACAELVRRRVGDGDEDALLVEREAAGRREMESMRKWVEKGKKEEEEIDLGMGLGDEDGEKMSKGKRKKERLLVFVGMYSIGKERIVKGIAQALSSKVYCDTYKTALFRAQDDPELHAMLTQDPYEAQVHVGMLQSINQESLSNYLGKYKDDGLGGRDGFTKIIGLRPTGWTYRPEGTVDKMPTVNKVLEREKLRTFSPAGMYPQRDSTPTHLAFGVPYSEHSSFFELTCFALSLNCHKWIPTVNVGSEASRKKMSVWFSKWADEKKRRTNARMPTLVPPRDKEYW